MKEFIKGFRQARRTVQKKDHTKRQGQSKNVVGENTGNKLKPVNPRHKEHKLRKIRNKNTNEKLTKTMINNTRNNIVESDRTSQNNNMMIEIHHDCYAN